MRVTRQVELVAKKVGKSKSTIWRWRKDGCDISSSGVPAGDKLRRNLNAFQKSNKENISAGPVADPQESENQKTFLANYLSLIELGPIGPKGEAAALARLEATEERAHARVNACDRVWQSI